jgi:hypothetical protein
MVASLRSGTLLTNSPSVNTGPDSILLLQQLAGQNPETEKTTRASKLAHNINNSLYDLYLACRQNKSGVYYMWERGAPHHPHMGDSGGANPSRRAGRLPPAPLPLCRSMGAPTGKARLVVGGGGDLVSRCGVRAAAWGGNDVFCLAARPALAACAAVRQIKPAAAACASTP